MPDPGQLLIWSPPGVLGDVHKSERTVTGPSFPVYSCFRRTGRTAVPSPSPSGPRSHTSTACRRRYDLAVPPGRLPVDGTLLLSDGSFAAPAESLASSALRNAFPGPLSLLGAPCRSSIS